MPVLASLLSLALASASQASTRPDPQTLVVQWAAAISQARAEGSPIHMSPSAGSYDAQFCQMNQGIDGSLDTLSEMLRTGKPEVRRAAATVLVAVRAGIGNQPGEWQRTRSQELSLAAKYVLDRDTITAENATNTVIELLDGEAWDGWGRFQPKWVRALGSAKGARQRNLTKLFAFTTVPVTGASSALYRSYRAGDATTKPWAVYALSRARLLTPTSLSQVALTAPLSPQSEIRKAGYRTLRDLSPVLWNASDAREFVAREVDSQRVLASAWQGCTIPERSGVLLTEPYELRNGEMLQVLDQGLEDSEVDVRLSSAMALVPIAKSVDRELGMGSSIHFMAPKKEVGKLLIKAANTIERDDSILARELRGLAQGFDRPRVIT